VVRRLLGFAALLALPLTAHAQGWLLMCPQPAQSGELIERLEQIHAYDWAAECEQVRPAFEANCRKTERRRKLTYTCNCRCVPVRHGD
jgi:hypothetical protein